MPPQPPDLSKEPIHKFCEQVQVIHSKDAFFVALRSGGEQSAYVFLPEHAKSLLRALQTEVDKYEAAYGKLEGRINTDPTPSPINLTSKGPKKDQK